MSSVDTDLIVCEQVKEVITVANWAQSAFRKAYDEAIHALDAGLAVELIMNPIKKTRSLEANAAMWAHLADLSRQIVWYGQKLSKEEWKDVISASLRELKVVPGIDRKSFVVLGMSTRKMSIKEMANMIEACLAFGAEQGVRFTAPRWMYEDQRRQG